MQQEKSKSKTARNDQPIGWPQTDRLATLHHLDPIGMDQQPIRMEILSKNTLSFARSLVFWLKVLDSYEYLVVPEPSFMTLINSSSI